MLACCPYNRLRHPRQLRNLQAVALRSWPGLDSMQEHDAVLVLDSREMDIGGRRMCFGKLCEFEVMCCKQCEAACAVYQMTGNGPGECEAVEG